MHSTSDTRFLVRVAGCLPSRMIHWSLKGFPCMPCWPRNVWQGAGNASEHWPSMHPTTLSSVAYTRHPGLGAYLNIIPCVLFVLSIHSVTVPRTRRFTKPSARSGQLSLARVPATSLSLASRSLQVCEDVEHFPGEPPAPRNAARVKNTRGAVILLMYIYRPHAMVAITVQYLAHCIMHMLRSRWVFGADSWTKLLPSSQSHNPYVTVPMSARCPPPVIPPNPKGFARCISSPGCAAQHASTSLSVAAACKPSFR